MESGVRDTGMQNTKTYFRTIPNSFCSPCFKFINVLVMGLTFDSIFAAANIIEMKRELMTGSYI